MTSPRLDELEAFRLFELPRPAESQPGADPDPGRRQRIAALAAAYHGAAQHGAAQHGGAQHGGAQHGAAERGAAERSAARNRDSTVGTIAFGWCRPRADRPIDLLAAGDVTGSRDPAGGLVLSLPAGARATELPPGTLAATLGAVPVWTRVAAVTDGLLLEPDRETFPSSGAPTLADSLLAVWREAFAWLALAVAIPPDEADQLAAEVGAAAREAMARAGGSPEYAVRSARLEARHRVLRRAESTGLWRVHLLAGGADERSARRVAALLCTAVDLTGTPYALVPTGVTGPLDEILSGQSWRRGSAEAPFVAGSPVLAALLREPRTEVPGVRLRLRPEFDVTPETAPGDETAPGGESVRLGAVLDAAGFPVGPFAVPTESLVRHVFVSGATGAGKSQTVRALLEEATRLDLPWLVVEPSKAEYRAMAARLPAVPVIAVRPGDVLAVPAGLNPLEPAPGFPLQTHVDLVRALFVAAFEADEPFPQVLSAALTRCYQEQGWHLALGRPQRGAHQPRYPTLADLQRAGESVVADIGYGREVTDNVRGFIRVRLGSLRLGTTGRFFEGGHPIDFAELLRNRVVFEIEDVGDDQDKAFLMGTVLIRLAEHLRVDHRQAARGPVPLRHLAVFEEAHRLLRRREGRGPAAHAVELFAALLAEIRAYGEGIVVADQIPSKLVPDVIKNTAVKILHRLPARDDRDVVGATMNLTDAQSTFLVTLPPGTAAVFTDGMDFPVLAMMPDGTAREATPVEPASPAGLVGRRSDTCGRSCRDRPCTLTDIETARDLLDRPGTGWLALWGEICVLAHLTGWAAPGPAAELLATARALPPRLRECVLGHAADAAVATRSAVVVRTASPAGLAAHVADAMRQRLVRGGGPCPAEEPEWLAEPFRWSLVWDELTRLVRDQPTAPRHPRSAEWEAWHRRRVPGSSAAEQLDAVRRWYAAAERDAGTRRAVFFGADRPSTLERVVGVAADSEDWPARLAAALAQFDDVSWAKRYLNKW